MEHWEFLLQKEGDRSWLPLDSPDVEILEGRYRIVARSNNSNATIETRITHVATKEVPPKRRVQKRSCHTNQDGLMVVIPFTRLEPGLWELQCSPSDLLTDLMAGAQPHAVTLQVVAREVDEDWDLDWTAPAEASVTSSVLRAENSRTIATSSIEVDTLAGNALTEHPTPLAETALPSSATGHPSSDDRQSPVPSEVAEILGASMDRLFQIAEELSGQLVDEVLQDFDLNAIADATPTEAANSRDRPDTTAPTVTVSDSAAPPHPDLPLAGHYTLSIGEAFSLTLDQTTFVAGRGDALTISGQVAIVQDTAAPTASSTNTASTESNVDPANVNLWESDDSFNLAGATAQTLQLCLRDPQSLQILVNDRQPLPSSAFPCSFTFSFSLPETFSTHLVLGEVLLCGSLPGKLEAAIALITQAFSITVDPTALMGELAKLHDALTTEIDDEERIDLPLELSSRLKEQAAPPLDLSFLKLTVVEPPDEQAPRFPSLAGQPLPPQLYRPNPEQTNSKPLDLPAFKLNNPLELAAATQPESTTPGASASEAISPATKAAGSDTVNASEALQASQDHLADAAPSAAIDDTTGVSVPSEVITAITPDHPPTDSTDQTLDTDKTLDLPSPTHMAFQSLKLQDRFLTRLTSLATDTELSALLKANLSPGCMPLGAATAPSAADARSLTEEIVVDDEPPLKERRRSQQPTFEPSPDEQPNPLILPADDPVPTPTLEVVTGELVSGQLINIRVHLPNLLPRIYVKLWLTDRQTRSLLEGPRWLVDFLPNGMGELEAMTPLTVPFGSVEIRLEAIAVEMHTQRESHKVTVDRVVVPPNLPSVSLDDFNE